MKRITAVIFFVMTVSGAGAENIFDFYWNIGNVGFGIDYSSENDDSIELTASAINLAFEHKDANIGIDFNLVKYWHFFKFQNEPETKANGEKFSFINASLYCDLIENYSILLGPFATINYLFVNLSNGINMNEYIFSAGLRFSYRPKFDFFGYKTSQVFNTEIGCRNITGKTKFYFSINVDVILALMGVAYSYVE